ncbi:hypothetical protein OH76DRAFT_1482544 [Lentinus brumalis]|uniref:Uncharacterized protein n=1 Tax=Lentinus brumalis TaxID=2498619 RepID=A0A371DBZ4_9APHY|nr:hypothetical protein OH76DRAFT_1482544 [Polyporus brumalis]
MMYQHPDPSLESHFLDGQLDVKPEVWVPGQPEEYAWSVESHCRRVAADLRDAGRAGLGKTVRLDEFVNLFLTPGQHNFLYENTPWSRRPSALTVSTLSPSYIAVVPDLPQEPWQFVSGAPALGTRDVDQMLAQMERYRPTERWPLLWPEFRKAILEYVPSDLWPLSPQGTERYAINPYVGAAAVWTA